MNDLKRYYSTSIFVSVLCIALGTYFWGLEAGFVILCLACVEIVLSFDNAVVNARVLENWDEKWRKRFLTWGILVAVFGMRLLFPIAIVTMGTGIGPVDVVSMALNSPDVYAQHLTAIHHQVAGFGGAFLLMVGLGFFFEEKTTYWLDALEERLVKLGQLEGVAAAFALVIAYVISQCMTNPIQGVEFFIAAVFGVVSYIVVHGLASILGGDDAADGVIKAGLAGFCYLELLDMVFSGDSTIAAFVFSNYLPIITIGLSIGALFVRSMTIHLVDSGKLVEYRFLEHGAFYAIIVLTGIMFLSAIGIHLPEWVTGLLSMTMIALAVWRSMVHNKRDVVAS